MKKDIKFWLKLIIVVLSAILGALGEMATGTMAAILR